MFVNITQSLEKAIHPKILDTPLFEEVNKQPPIYGFQVVRMSPKLQNYTHYSLVRTVLTLLVLLPPVIFLQYTLKKVSPPPFFFSSIFQIQHPPNLVFYVHLSFLPEAQKGFPDSQWPVRAEAV